MEFIKDSYYGNIKPTDQYFIKGPKYQSLSNTEDEIRKDLVTRLSEHDRILFDEFCNCLVKQSIILEETHYISGFHDGARMMVDVLQGEDKISRGGGEKGEVTK